ncbi:MAG: heat-inducible transcription repressor HrcA [Gaiellales bacterium]|nr:MAG: heat-inducible transcription repressor HrcA [Gaiellales bacterium]
MDGTGDLTARQAEILAAVTRAYIKSGRPVGSRFLSDNAGFGLSPSTLRGELAGLERKGFLDHPHTSAGRVPTDKGYRFYVDNLADRRKKSIRALEALDSLEGEVEEALRDATALLARATGLLAMASLPSQGNAAIRHVEVLRLNPELVMVVVITATGGVVKRLFMFGEPVDKGLVSWARSFLNDSIAGLDLGSRILGIRLNEFELDPVERDFIEAIKPALEEVPVDGGDTLYIEGASRLVTRLEVDDEASAMNVVGMLDRHEEMLGLLRLALSDYRVCLRIGSELPAAKIRNCSLVAAGYGYGHRNLGTVGVLGPRRMDYPLVIGCVEQTARSLSQFIEGIY